MMIFNKGVEVCATVVGYVDGIDLYPGNDAVLTIVDYEGNLHSIQMKSNSVTITKLSKEQGQ